MPHSSSTQKILSTDFYRRRDVTRVARELLGTYLCTRIAGDPQTSGMIVETEAYAAQDDEACHASGYNRTERNDAMFREGGVAYVYLCYGIHNLFNVVTNIAGEPEAVLIRAVKPVEGVDTMLTRRGHSKVTPELAGGPGRLTETLGITRDHYGLSLQSDEIWIEDRGDRMDSSDIATSPRIGVDFAGSDAQKPWRFTVQDSKWTSR